MSKVIVSELFDTPEKRKEAVASLQALRANPGWHLFEKILTINIEQIEEDILSDIDMTREEERENKILRSAYIFMRDLPEREVTRLMTESMMQPTNDDPYDKPVA